MFRKAFFAATSLALVACSTGAGSQAVPTAGMQSLAAPDGGRTSPVSILKLLTKQSVIGSTVDAANGDQQPRGLTLGTYSFGKLKKGDLYTCNFANKAKAAGAGTTIEQLAPAAGAKPTRFYQSAALMGCSSIANDTVYMWASAYGAKSELQLGSKPSVLQTFKGGSYASPVNNVVAVLGSIYSTTTVFTADEATGSIIKTEFCSTGNCSSPGTAVITGLPVKKTGGGFPQLSLVFDPNQGASSICGPYPCGRLFVIDASNNTIVYVDNAPNLQTAKSIVVGPTGKTFSGPDAAWAKVLFSGTPLNAPVAGTMVYAAASKPGNLVVANSQPAAQNLLIELSPAAKVLASVNVDKGAAGAIGGLAATGSGSATALYFADDNANNVQVLKH